MKLKQMSRRTVLRGAGGIAVALPFLDAMRPRTTMAQSETVVPTRFGVFFSPCGAIMNNWKPTGGETDFQLSPALQPLADHRDDLIVLSGINNETSYMQVGNDHDLAMAHMLTAVRMRINQLGRANHVINGTVGGPSIDQAIAAAIGGGTKLRSLELGVECTTTGLEPMVVRMSYGGPDDPRTPLDDPQQAFTRLFGDTDAAQVELEAIARRRASVLDAVLGEFNAVDAKLGYDDRQRLARHAQAIRDLEGQLDIVSPTRTACQSPVRPTVTAELVDCLTNPLEPVQIEAKCLVSYAEVGKAQMDLMVLAFACDLSRVVSFQWSTAESTTLHSDLGANGEHHQMSHDLGTFNDDLKGVDTWYNQQFAYLLSEMKKIDEGEGTLLDNSLIFYPNELSQAQIHDRRDLPYLIAGKAGGKLTTGRYLNFNGAPHNQLYTSFLNLFGVEAEGFGEPDFPGTLSGFV
jgi:hypothetical protein